MIRVRLPFEYDGESLKDLLNEHIEDMYPALDLDVTVRDMRANFLEAEVTWVDIDGNEVDVQYEVTYDAYYGCKDIDSGGTYEEALTGTIANGYVSFDRFISPEPLAPNEEL